MGRLTLPLSGRIYFDANCFVYSLERISPYDAALERVWEAAYAGKARIVTSQLSLLESTVQPLR